MEPDFRSQEKQHRAASALWGEHAAMEPDFRSQEKHQEVRWTSQMLTWPQWSLTSGVRKRPFACQNACAADGAAMEPDFRSQEKQRRSRF